MDRAFTLPPEYERRIDSALRLHGCRLDEPRRLAAAVQRLSDFYIKQPDAPTPWAEPWAALAYACYYFPLNYLRARATIASATAVGYWTGLRTYVDFGSGVGTLPLALADSLPGQFVSGLAIERGKAAEAIYQALRVAPVALDWRAQVPAALPPDPTRLTTFSYALTELSALPPWALTGEALLVIEPATQQDGRRLLQLRADLLLQGWHVWGPCTHADACPLLTQSERDWCHDRIHWTAPAWFLALEAHLPMHNRSLTHSYLLLRKTPPPAYAADRVRARLTGDLRREKGASRQMVCRGPKREFLSWQHKHGEAPHWPRGGMVALDPATPGKSNELRPLGEQCQLISTD